METTNKVIIVSYNRSRAMVAIVFPIAVAMIPLGHAIISYRDFYRTYIDMPISTAILIAGLAWFVFSLWPDAINLLKSKRDSVIRDDDSMLLTNNNTVLLKEINNIEVISRFLRKDIITVNTEKSSFDIITAFQNFGSKISAEDIAYKIGQESIFHK